MKDRNTALESKLCGDWQQIFKEFRVRNAMGVFVLTHVSSRDMSFAAFFVKKKKKCPAQFEKCGK